MNDGVSVGRAHVLGVIVAVPEKFVAGFAPGVVE